MVHPGLKLAAKCGAVAACSYFLVLTVRGYVDEYTNEWLSENSEETRAFALVLKSEFQGAEVKPQRVIDNHTHGEAAADRSTASLLIQRVAKGVGRVPYFYQGSGSDQRSGRVYSREYHWAKDLMAAYAPFRPESSDIIAMVDVDYYVEMEDMLVDRFQPYMLYSFAPSRAARSDGDHGWCFNAQGEVRYHVAGGGWYSHPIWDWDGDSVRAYKRIAGCKVAMACYAIERRQIDVDHQVILLVPLLKTSTPWMTKLVENRVEARGMRHFNPIVGDFVRFYVNKHSGLEVATGKVGEYCSNVVPASVDSIVASAGVTISGKLTLTTVKSKLKEGGQDESKYLKAAEVLLEFHINRLPTTQRVSVVDGVRRFQWIPDGKEPDTDAKPGMSAFMLPLLDGGFVPDVTEGNEKRFVDKRIKEIATKEQPMDPFMLKCMDEFAAFLIPSEDVGMLMPVDPEVVYERQNRPSQRAILEAAEHGQPERVTKQFMKREAYGRVNDPRGISTINGVDKMMYSRFIYAFTDEILKRQDWYAFGKTPREVAARVAAICARAKVKVSKTDFERMDGRHGNILAYLEKTCLLRAFGPSYHNELVETWNRHHHLVAKTTFGIKYQMEWQRCSGGADTSGANTLDTGFIAYYTYRMMGLEPQEAWDALGIYGGDDGLSQDMHTPTAVKAAARVGQVLDLEDVNQGELGVAFLARRYGPDVWYGDTNSCCDIKRQISKFHLTTNLPSSVTPAQKLQEKSFSFFLTDANTPIIGEFCKRVLELFPLPKDKFRNELGIWGVEMDEERQYPNREAEWMEDIVTAELPDFDTTRFREWLRNSDGTSVFCPPTVADALPANPKPGVVAVDGDLLVTPDEQPGDGGKVATDEGEVDGKPHYRGRKPKAERPSHQMKTEKTSPLAKCAPRNPSPLVKGKPAANKQMAPATN